MGCQYWASSFEIGVDGCTMVVVFEKMRRKIYFSCEFWCMRLRHKRVYKKFSEDETVNSESINILLIYSPSPKAAWYINLRPWQRVGLSEYADKNIMTRGDIFNYDWFMR